MESAGGNYSSADEEHGLFNNTNESNASNVTKLPCKNYYCESMDDYYDRIQTYIVPETTEWILIITYIITFFVGLIGNSLVCFAIWRNKSMRTITNIFLVNLSIADLAVIIVCLPSALLVDVTETWFLGTVVCKVHLFLMSVSISVSILTLSSISIERWYAICHPLRFHSTVSRARMIIIIIWIVSSCAALPELIFSTVTPFKLELDTVLLSTCAPTLWNEQYQAIYQICLMVFMYFLPLCLMGFTYTKIALVLWYGHIPGVSASTRCRQQMLNPRGQVTTVDNEDQVVTRRKAAKMLVAVVVVFGLCFLPIHLLNILRFTMNITAIENVHIFALIAHWAMFLSSCVNPVIYNFMSDKFRKEFKVAVRLCVTCGRKSRPWNRNDMYKVTFNSARTISVRYSNHFPNSNSSNKTSPDNMTLNLHKL